MDKEANHTGGWEAHSPLQARSTQRLQKGANGVLRKLLGKGGVTSQHLRMEQPEGQKGSVWEGAQPWIWNGPSSGLPHFKVMLCSSLAVASQATTLLKASAVGFLVYSNKTHFWVLSTVILMWLLNVWSLTVIKASSHSYSHFEPNSHLAKNKYIIRFFFCMSEYCSPRKGSDLQKVRFRAYSGALTPHPATSEPQNISSRLELFLCCWPKLITLLQRQWTAAAVLEEGGVSSAPSMFWLDMFYESLSFEMFHVRRLSASDNKAYVSKRWRDQKWKWCHKDSGVEDPSLCPAQRWTIRQLSMNRNSFGRALEST